MTPRPRRRRVEVASVALRGLAAEADAARAMADADEQHPSADFDDFIAAPSASRRRSTDQTFALRGDSAFGDAEIRGPGLDHEDLIAAVEAAPTPAALDMIEELSQHTMPEHRRVEVASVALRGLAAEADAARAMAEADACAMAEAAARTMAEADAARAMAEADAHAMAEAAARTMAEADAARAMAEADAHAMAEAAARTMAEADVARTMAEADARAMTEAAARTMAEADAARAMAEGAAHAMAEAAARTMAEADAARTMAEADAARTMAEAAAGTMAEADAARAMAEAAARTMAEADAARAMAEADARAMAEAAARTMAEAAAARAMAEADARAMAEAAARTMAEADAARAMAEADARAMVEAAARTMAEADAARAMAEADARAMTEAAARTMAEADAARTMAEADARAMTEAAARTMAEADARAMAEAAAAHDGRGRRAAPMGGRRRLRRRAPTSRGERRSGTRPPSGADDQTFALLGDSAVGDAEVRRPGLDEVASLTLRELVAAANAEADAARAIRPSLNHEDLIAAVEAAREWTAPEDAVAAPAIGTSPAQGTRPSVTLPPASFSMDLPSAKPLVKAVWTYIRGGYPSPFDRVKRASPVALVCSILAVAAGGILGLQLPESRRSAVEPSERAIEPPESGAPVGLDGQTPLARPAPVLLREAADPPSVPPLVARSAPRGSPRIEGRRARFTEVPDSYVWSDPRPARRPETPAKNTATVAGSRSLSTTSAAAACTRARCCEFRGRPSAGCGPFVCRRQSQRHRILTCADFWFRVQQRAGKSHSPAPRS